MKDTDQETGQLRNDYYVYTWFRPDKECVFYVGKGRGGRANKLNRRNIHFKRIIEKLSVLGLEPVVTIVASGLTESESFDLEKALIRKHRRRKDGGTLCNMTDGGDGSSGTIHSEETRRKRSQSVREALSAPEVKEKLRISILKRFSDPAVRAAHGAKVSERYKDPAEREKMSVPLKGVKKTRVHIRRVAETLTKTWADNIERREAHRRLSLRRGPSTRNSSGYKGVSFDKTHNKWLAQIEVEGWNKHLGRFTDPVQAAIAYDIGARRFYGDDVYLNFPHPDPANDNLIATEIKTRA